MDKDKSISGFKGFDENLKCRGFQYEIGGTFEHKGSVSCCESGFHFYENPFDVFEYYPPNKSRYCSVEGSGCLSKNGNDYDSKLSVSKLHVSAEIGLKGIIDAGVKFILDKVNFSNNKKTNTGNRSAATNTGDRSAATNTGYCSAATNTGDCSAAIVKGDDSVAISTGKDGMAMGTLGCWIVLTERGEWNGKTYPIICVKSFKVDGKNIKENTFYKLINGNAVEVSG